MALTPTSASSRSSTRRGIGRLAATAVLAASALTASALGQSRGQDEDPQTLLKEFIHYTLVAQPGLAAGYGQQLLESGITDEEMARLVEGGEFDLDRLDRAIDRGLRVAELEQIAGLIGRRIEDGRLALAREGERIRDAIRMLVGSQRERLIAEDRLDAAGEYAVPALLNVVVESRDERLRAACRRMLVEIGRVAVTPLTVALSEVDPATQRSICEMLGEIGYAHAGPALRELALNEDAPGTVRDAAQRAFDRIVGGDDALDVLWTRLARDHFDDLGSLVAYPFDAVSNVWRYDAFSGLIATPVPTVIYNEIMAMRASREALDEDARNREAIGLYVASNLRRENDLPPGSMDPIHGDSPYSPSFYATVFGTGICLDVLGLGLDTNDTPLVRDAIRALAETTGGSNLFTSADRDRIALVEAMQYPDRRVNYEAALVLANALPRSNFDGANRVIPTLSGAIRDAGVLNAFVVGDDPENRRNEARRLEAIGFTVAGEGATAADIAGAMQDVPAVDAVVIRTDDREAAIQAHLELRRYADAAAAPILVVAAPVDRAQLQLEFRANPSTLVVGDVTDDGWNQALEDLMRRATGGMMTSADAEIFTIEALSAMRDVAISNTTAYRVADAEDVLLDALRSRSGGTRLLVADILALIDSEDAQQALFDAALDASGGEQVDLLGRVAESVKRHGDQAAPRHVTALLQLVADSSGSLAEAAATVHGALNRGTGDAVGLIR